MAPVADRLPPSLTQNVSLRTWNALSGGLSRAQNDEKQRGEEPRQGHESMLTDRSRGKGRGGGGRAVFGLREKAEGIKTPFPLSPDTSQVPYKDQCWIGRDG